MQWPATISSSRAGPAPSTIGVRASSKFTKLVTLARERLSPEQTLRWWLHGDASGETWNWSDGRRRRGFRDFEVSTHLVEFLTSGQELVALGELADDLLRRMPAALVRCHDVVDSSCSNTRATESHNDRTTREGSPQPDRWSRVLVRRRSGWPRTRLGCGSREKLWRDTLLTLDRDLLLVRKHHSMFTLDLAQYLFARSSSHINSLISLIAHGPCKVIASGHYGRGPSCWSRCSRRRPRGPAPESIAAAT